MFLVGTKMIERAFQANNRNASAANALCELFLRKGSYTRVSEIKGILGSAFIFGRP